MANKTVKGSRVAVKLPFKGASDNKDQFVKMKRPTAKLLGFDLAKTSELFYLAKIQKKDEDGKTISGTTEVKRAVRPGYKQRNFVVVFKDEKTLEDNTKKFQSVGFPVTKSVLVYDVIKYFESGGGKSLNAIKLITDSGASYPINAT